MTECLMILRNYFIYFLGMIIILWSCFLKNLWEIYAHIFIFKMIWSQDFFLYNTRLWDTGLNAIRPSEPTIVAGWWKYGDLLYYFIQFCKYLKFSIIISYHEDKPEIPPSVASLYTWKTAQTPCPCVPHCPQLPMPPPAQSFSHWPSGLFFMHRL